MRAAKAASFEESARCFRIYSCYLEACGWSEQEFDNETLRRIDNDWEFKWVN